VLLQTPYPHPPGTLIQTVLFVTLAYLATDCHLAVVNPNVETAIWM